MKHLFKGLFFVLSLISLAACSPSIKEGYIVDKHMTESKETNAYMMGDETIFWMKRSPPNTISMYTAKTTVADTVTVQVDENAYNNHKIGDFGASAFRRGKQHVLWNFRPKSKSASDGR